MDAIDRYRLLPSDLLPIFHQPFYLDAVAPEEWDVALYIKGDAIKASLPYKLSRTRSIKSIIQPSMTQYLGPWIYKMNDQDQNVSEYHAILNSLFEDLPNHDFYEQSWHYKMSNWTPLYWKGYDQKSLFTYQINKIKSEEEIRRRFNSNTKRNLKKGLASLELREVDDFTSFFEMIKSTFHRKNEANPYSHQVFENLDHACANNNCRKILGAYDNANNLCGAIYLIWDKWSVYYLAGGVPEEHKNKGAMQFLFWHAIKYTQGQEKIFDFEGSMIPSVELFFRSFGGFPQAYNRIKKIHSKRLKIKYKTKELIEAIKL